VGDTERSGSFPATPVVRIVRVSTLQGGAVRRNIAAGNFGVEEALRRLDPSGRQGFSNEAILAASERPPTRVVVRRTRAYHPDGDEGNGWPERILASQDTEAEQRDRRRHGAVVERSVRADNPFVEHSNDVGGRPRSPRDCALSADRGHRL